MMIDALIRWCLKNIPLVLIAMVAAMAAGYYAIVHTPIDAIPDIGEKQVIVYVDWPGRSPQDVDDQVTYPLTTSLTGTPGVKAIRSMSGFGFSMVFVIFNRVMKKALAAAKSDLPSLLACGAGEKSSMYRSGYISGFSPSPRVFLTLASINGTSYFSRRSPFSSPC